MVTFTKPKDVKPFMMWVVDLHVHLGVPMAEAFEIAHETWTRPEMEEERAQRKNCCKEMKEVLRVQGGVLQYEGLATCYLPSLITKEYRGRLRRIWAVVDSERMNGIGEDMSDIDHFNGVCS